MEESLKGYFEDVASTCIECGACAEIQRQGNCPSHEYGPLAKDFLQESESGDYSNKMMFALFTCALCGECTAECPVDISAAEFTRNARFQVSKVMPERVAQYRPMLTDLKGNVFSGLLEAQGVEYPDALADDAPEATQGESLFFPGCTLSAYAPELTNKTMDYLREAGQADAITALCCGNPLRGIGILDRYETYVGHLSDRMVQRGVKRIIAACPNCYYSLREAQDDGLFTRDIDVVCLPELLVERGQRIAAEAALSRGVASYAVHDSCPDRFERRFATSIRALLPEGTHVAEMDHAGLDAICCGSGGMVSFENMKICELRRARRLAEFDQTNAECLVTGCISCSNSMRRGDATTPTYHYLELLFDTQIDWDGFLQAQIDFDAHGGYDFNDPAGDVPLFAEEG